MTDLTKIYLDLSKCSEEQRKQIAKVLSDNNQPCYQGLLKCLKDGYYNRTFYLLSFFKRRDLWCFAHEGLESTENKTELTYPEFIKLFEGGEGTTDANTFEKELFALVNSHCERGLSKPDLIRKIEWVLGSCKMS